MAFSLSGGGGGVKRLKNQHAAIPGDVGDCLRPRLSHLRVNGSNAERSRQITGLSPVTRGALRVGIARVERDQGERQQTTSLTARRKFCKAQATDVSVPNDEPFIK